MRTIDLPPQVAAIADRGAQRLGFKDPEAYLVWAAEIALFVVERGGAIEGERGLNVAATGHSRYVVELSEDGLIEYDHWGNCLRPTMTSAARCRNRDFHQPQRALQSFLEGRCIRRTEGRFITSARGLFVLATARVIESAAVIPT